MIALGAVLAGLDGAADAFVGLEVLFELGALGCM